MEREDRPDLFDFKSPRDDLCGLDGDVNIKAGRTFVVGRGLVGVHGTSPKKLTPRCNEEGSSKRTENANAEP